MEGNIRVDGNAEVERHAANLRMQGCMSVLKKQTKAEDDANGGGAMERKWRISICSVCDGVFMARRRYHTDLICIHSTRELSAHPSQIPRHPLPQLPKLGLATGFRSELSRVSSFR